MEIYPIMKNRAAIALAIATALAIPAEGLRQWAYKCPAGVVTVCYGHTGSVIRGKKYTLDECKALLDADMLKAVQEVEQCQPGLPPEVLAAFADATFNIGSRVACDTRQSTAARKLKAGDYRGACEELPKWNKARVGGVLVALPGLTKRRAREREICLQGV